MRQHYLTQKNSQKLHVILKQGQNYGSPWRAEHQLVFWYFLLLLNCLNLYFNGSICLVGTLLKTLTCFDFKNCAFLLDFVSLCPGWLTHWVTLDKVHRLFVTLSYFRPDRFVQLLSLIQILILLLYLLVSIDLVYTSIYGWRPSCLRDRLLIFWYFFLLLNCVNLYFNGSICLVGTLLKTLTCFDFKNCAFLLDFVSLCPGWLTHWVTLDKVHRLFVTLSYFRPDRFVQLLSLIQILILLLYLLVSIDLVYTSIYGWRPSCLRDRLLIFWYFLLLLNCVNLYFNGSICLVGTLLKSLTCFDLKNFAFLLNFVSLCSGWLTHRVTSDKVHRLVVTLSYFRPNRFVQLLSLIQILILLLYLLVSIDLVYTSIYGWRPSC